MVIDTVHIDLGLQDPEDSNYKSCFARSVVVNSQYKQTKPKDPEEHVKKEEHTRKYSYEDFILDNNSSSSSRTMENTPDIRWRKSPRINIDDDRRLSCSSIASSRRTSICSSRITEIPVENIAHQSKIETLQWQLKEAERNREMYRAVMNQVVTFLERAHKSLEVIGTKLNSPKTVSRSKSDHQMLTPDTSNVSDNKSEINCNDDYTAFRDFTWRRPKKQGIVPEEVPPDKLAQEAFRLLRTIQSLLNTREPNLAHVTNDPSDDIEFLAQLAKEFPQSSDNKPQRTTSFSLCPKLIMPEKDSKLSSTFNRQLSLQISEVRRRNMHKNSRMTDSVRTSIAENDNGLFSPCVTNDHHASLLSSNKSYNIDKIKSELEKSNSPPASGSISSGEDESGFSSMNSFQDVGLPIVNSTTISEDVSSKNVLLRNMLHTNLDYLSNLSSSGYTSLLNTVPERKLETDRLNDIKLWEKPDNITYHKRFSSTPAETTTKEEKQTMNVLWV